MHYILYYNMLLRSRVKKRSTNYIIILIYILICAVRGPENLFFIQITVFFIRTNINTGFLPPGRLAVSRRLCSICSTTL